MRPDAITSQDIERQINAVLGGLRDVKSPAGMEQRILRRLDERPASSSAWKIRWSVWPLRAGALGLVTAACAFVMISIHSHPVKNTGTTNETTSMAHTEAIPSAHHDAEPPSVEVERSVATGNLHQHRLETKTSQNTLARDEMNAPSQPAPELPLTQQERQLRKIVHQAPPNEFASLNISSLPPAAIPEENIRAFFSGFTQQSNIGDLPQ